jgi:hypothetical protein
VITAVQPGLDGEFIDATGLHVFPGGLDPHVHFNEPGRTHWEGLASGSAALARGGFTAFFDMPLNSTPPTADAAAFDAKLAAARAQSSVDFGLWGALVPGNRVHMEALAERGVIGFKAFMSNSGIEDFARADDVTLYEGASFDLDAALIAGAGQTIELVTTMRHFEANATSRQTVRGIAGSNGTISYLGKVAVSRDAQKTDSVQSVKGMLLDRTATVNAKPELEIFADDVKCAHGATVGELDAQALFYLASRGLPPAQAKAVLLRAFVSGLFDGSVDEATFAAAIDAALERVL